jgi:sterol desaturase/sphingolipid hydroxylase (fatty acid hydroxylase superfamily)
MIYCDIKCLNWYYLVNEIQNPSLTNYFWWLVGLSLLVLSIEIISPWRKNQKIIRNGFWLDLFYVFFNFFLFSLIGYNAVSNIVVELFNDVLGLIGIENLVAFQVQNFPIWSQFLIMFLLADFIQWNIHIQLHKQPWLWKFHKVHQSVKEMGFAA